MTEDAIIVVLDIGASKEDVEKTMKVIESLKHVVSVKSHSPDVSSIVAKERARIALRTMLTKILDEL